MMSNTILNIISVPAGILAFVNIFYAVKIIANVIKEKKTDEQKQDNNERNFWITLFAPWFIMGIAEIIAGESYNGFHYLGSSFCLAFLVCPIRLIYIILKKKSESRKKWITLTAVSFTLFMTFFYLGNNAEPEDVKQARIERQEQERKQQEEQKKLEEQKMAEKVANEKKREIEKKEEEISARLMEMNEEDIALYKSRYQEYQQILDEQEAKEKAINDVDEAKEKKRKELQEAYDKQEQYEEWIAWQKSEAEKEARNRPMEVTAYEMLELFNGNRDAAKSKYLGRKVNIHNCRISYIGNGVILCKPMSSEIFFSGIKIRNAKKLSNYMELRTDDIINVSGVVMEVNEKIGTNGLGKDMYGYVVKLE